MATSLVKTLGILFLSCWLIPAAHCAPVEMMLPGIYAEGRDITDWLISEKLDVFV
jgi:hypothetical protein